MGGSDPTTPTHASSHHEQIYTFGYSHAAIQIMMGRTAENSASFLLPHLRPGMRVLDCGSGPGSITLGLAQAVAPGEAVGVDLEPSQVALASTLAEERGVTNVRFDVGNVYALPFPDSTFDAAFGHTILMQFRDPVVALTDIHRVLKPGGVVGFREIAFDGNLYEPPDAAWRQFWELFARVLQHNGGNAHVGKRLGALVHQAGFHRITMGATYNHVGTPELKRAMSEATARFCEQVDFLDQALALGWVDQDTRPRLSAALRAEGSRIEGFFAAAFCDVVAWKADAAPS